MLYSKITGTVQHGNKLGRKIGFPTANISVKTVNIHPGTYKCNIVIGEETHSGIGSYKNKTQLFEVHIFDFEKDIYDQEITIIPIYFLRENKKFENVEDLQTQIKKDKERAITKKTKVITFGTFDRVHPGHTYYLSESKKYGDTLITLVATDENIKKIKKIPPESGIDKRIEDVKNIGISDFVIAGSNNSPLFWIEKYDPNIVCLGYDQIGFIQVLETYIKETGIDMSIIRIPAYKETIYKSSLLKNK
ncbi:adenylyltransferase/cytidyltransferase family protein [Candidatus Gracilibacteria bacterium]|nr:adenylyltransferase/cytidyltransferase family protein [Candidatus Gracilibacteria bacterium]